MGVEEWDYQFFNKSPKAVIAGHPVLLFIENTETAGLPIRMDVKVCEGYIKFGRYSVNPVVAQFHGRKVRMLTRFQDYPDFINVFDPLTVDISARIDQERLIVIGRVESQRATKHHRI